MRRRRHPPSHAPFTTTKVDPSIFLPCELARLAHESFTLLGHPDADVQLQPDDDEVDQDDPFDANVRFPPLLDAPYGALYA